MAFRSVAQRNKMQEFLKAGKITQQQLDQMAQGTPEHLPERLHPKMADRRRMKRTRPAFPGTKRGR